MEQGPDREEDEAEGGDTSPRPESPAPPTGGVRIIGAETAADITSEVPVVPPAQIVKDTGAARVGPDHRRADRGRRTYGRRRPRRTAALDRAAHRPGTGRTGPRRRRTVRRNPAPHVARGGGRLDRPRGGVRAGDVQRRSCLAGRARRDRRHGRRAASVGVRPQLGDAGPARPRLARRPDHRAGRRGRGRRRSRGPPDRGYRRPPGPAGLHRRSHGGDIGRRCGRRRFGAGRPGSRRLVRRRTHSRCGSHRRRRHPAVRRAPGGAGAAEWSAPRPAEGEATGRRRRPGRAAGRRAPGGIGRRRARCGPAQTRSCRTGRRRPHGGTGARHRGVGGRCRPGCRLRPRRVATASLPAEVRWGSAAPVERQLRPRGDRGRSAGAGPGRSGAPRPRGGRGQHRGSGSVPASPSPSSHCSPSSSVP